MAFDALVEKIITYGYLPKGEEWLVCDEAGFTIAHYYARLRPLPKDFKYLDLKDNDGVTVQQIAEAAGTYTKQPSKDDTRGKKPEDKLSWKEYKEHSQSFLDNCFDIVKAGTRIRR